MNKSRTFLEQRQIQTAERLDPKWQPVRNQPVMESGNIHYEVAGRTHAIGCGGLGMLQVVVDQTGLRSAIDESVGVLKRRKPYHESDHVLAQAFNFLAGGRCLEDLDRWRQNAAFLDALGARRIPGSSTAGDFLRRFDSEYVGRLMGAVRQASRNVWRSRPKSQRRLAIIDVDGTTVETTGECKERMDIDYRGRWGFGPLVVSLANTQEVLAVVNRPANRPSHDGCTAWLDTSIAWAKQDVGFEKVRLRGDTDFSLTTNFDRWHTEGVEFVFGMDASKGLIRRAQELPETAWDRLERPGRPVRRRRPHNVKAEVIEQRGFKNLDLVAEDVAEIAYRPSKAKGTYRLIALRKQIRTRKGQLQLEDEIRYFFYITNVSAKQMSPMAVVRESNARCHQENLIEQLKNGVQATRMPVGEFDANWAYMVIGALAWNIKAWAGLLLPKSMGAQAILKMEFRRFLDEIILVPTQIVRTGRRLVFRLLAVNSWTNLLLEGTQQLKRRRYASTS
jgi:hypothetical protein